MQHPEEKDFYTVKELADLLSFTERTIRERLERGEMEGAKLGGKGPWRIASAEVGRLLRGEKPAEDLLELATQFKAQLSIPTPGAILIDNFGEPGHHTIPLKQDIIRVTWGNSGEDTRTIKVIKESWRAAEVAINVVVSADGTLGLFCPVEEKFQKLLSSLSQGAQEQFTVWKQQGGDYLRRCMDIRWEISADVIEGASELIYQAAQNFPKGFSPSLDDLLTSNFANLVYQRAILYCRTRGKVDIPVREMYRTRRRSPTFCELYLGSKRLAKAPCPPPFAPSFEFGIQLLEALGDLHRDKITKWSTSPAVAELVELFGSLRGIEQAIKEELDHLS